MSRTYSVYTYVDVETDMGDAEREYRLDYTWTPIREKLYGPPEDCFPAEGGAEFYALYEDGVEILDPWCGLYNNLIAELLDEADVEGSGEVSYD